MILHFANVFHAKGMQMLEEQPNGLTIILSLRRNISTAKLRKTQQGRERQRNLLQI